MDDNQRLNNNVDANGIASVNVQALKEHMDANQELVVIRCARGI